MGVLSQLWKEVLNGRFDSQLCQGRLLHWESFLVQQRDN